MSDQEKVFPVSDKLRLKVYNVATYDCPSCPYGVVIQKFVKNHDPVSNIPGEWSDDYVIARFSERLNAFAFIEAHPEDVRQSWVESYFEKWEPDKEQ